MAAQGSSEPRIRVGALVLLDDKVVLVRHRKEGRSYYLLPGGGVRWGETLAQALVREVAEETGLEVEPGSLLFVNDTVDPSGARHVVNLTFRATPVGGRPTNTPGDERVEAVELVDVDRLDSLDLRPPFADRLSDALAGPVDASSAYLGPLFKPEG